MDQTNIQLQQQLHSIFIYVVVITIALGLISLFLNIYPWWYVDKEGKKAGLDDFTISQWRWKALWIGWIAIFLFKRYLKVQRNNTSKKPPDDKF